MICATFKAFVVFIAALDSAFGRDSIFFSYYLFLWYTYDRVFDEDRDGFSRDCMHQRDRLICPRFADIGNDFIFIGDQLKRGGVL